MIYNFKVSGEEEQIVSVERELLEILKRALDHEEMLAHEIHFCIHESILNIIQHSYKWDLSVPIDIRLTFSGAIDNGNGVLEIQIRDYGPPIANEIHAPASIEKFQMRHRGLYMISKIMDEFYIKPFDNGNLTYMKKNLVSENESVC